MVAAYGIVLTAIPGLCFILFPPLLLPFLPFFCSIPFIFLKILTRALPKFIVLTLSSFFPLIFLFSNLGFLMTVGTLLIFVYRNEPFIKARNPTMLIFQNIGMMISALLTSTCILFFVVRGVTLYFHIFLFLWFIQWASCK